MLKISNAANELDQQAAGYRTKTKLNYPEEVRLAQSAQSAARPHAARGILECCRSHKHTVLTCQSTSK